MSLLAKAIVLFKAAQVEKAPDTSPQYFDEQFQAYQFLGFLNTLAHIKNQLAKIKNNFPMFDSIFGVLVRLRPGTIKKRHPTNDREQFI